MERKIISKLHGEAFLVCDRSLKNINASFYKFLRNEGFEMAWYKGHYEVCDWAFVNITHKMFAYGMPGIKITTPVGNHAITKEEFMTIYNIYKNYEGEELFTCRKKSHNEEEENK